MTAYLWLGIGSGVLTFAVAYLCWLFLRGHRLRADLREIEADLIEAASVAGLLDDPKVRTAIGALDRLAANAAEFTFPMWLSAMLNSGDDRLATSPEWPEEFRTAYERARARASDRLYVAATRESLSGLVIAVLCNLFYGFVLRPWVRARVGSAGIVSGSADEVDRRHNRPLRPAAC